MLMQCDGAEIYCISVAGPISLYGKVTSIYYYLDLTLVNNYLLLI